MTILKGAAAIGVDRFRPMPILSVEEAAPRPDPRLAKLETEVARLTASLDLARQDGVAKAALAREEGAREVLLDHEAHLAAVERGMDAALLAWRTQLAETEALAVSLARVALSRMFDEHDDLFLLVERTVRTYLGRIGPDAVISVRVSPVDFADAGRLGALERQGATVRLDPSLASGEARVELRLGEAELDLSAQRREIDQALAAFSATAAAP